MQSLSPQWARKLVGHGAVTVPYPIGTVHNTDKILGTSADSHGRVWGFNSVNSEGRTAVDVICDFDTDSLWYTVSVLIIKTYPL